MAELKKHRRQYGDADEHVGTGPDVRKIENQSQWETHSDEELAECLGQDKQPLNEVALHDVTGEPSQRGSWSEYRNSLVTSDRVEDFKEPRSTDEVEPRSIDMED